MNDGAQLLSTVPPGTDGALQVTVLAPIDVHNANAMRDTGVQLIAEAQANAVNFDLSRVAANSVALAVLISWRAGARAHAREMRCTGMSSALAAVVEFSGVKRLLDPDSAQAKA